MNTRQNLIALALLAPLLTACGGETTTDQPLPEGVASNEVEPAPQNTAPGEDASATAPGTDPSPDASAADPLGDVADLISPVTGAVEAVKDAAERRTAPGISYVLPEGWKVGPPKSMRLLTLVPPAEFGEAELALSKWPGDVGGFGPNITRWARQAGVSVDGIKRTDFPQIDVGGTQSAYIPLVNKDANTAILALWVPRGENPDRPIETWTFKLSNCTAEDAIKLEPMLKAWAGSVKFE